jgi:hypothetical protein
MGKFGKLDEVRETLDGDRHAMLAAIDKAKGRV